MGGYEGVFWEPPGTVHGPKHDEWGHVESVKLPDEGVAGLLERIGPDNTIVGCRLLYSRDGNPAGGYDRVWEYPTIQAAEAALRKWVEVYPKPPRGFTRDYHKKPIPWED